MLWFLSRAGRVAVGPGFLSSSNGVDACREDEPVLAVEARWRQEWLAMRPE